MSDREQFILRQAAKFDDMVKDELGMSANEALKVFSQGRLKVNKQQLQQAHRQGWEQAKAEARVLSFSCSCGKAITGMEYKGLRMTDNEKLARWQGWNREKNHSHWWRTPEFELVCRYPDYLNDDAAAMSLLDTLVEKGYAVAIASRSHKWDIGIARNDCNLDYCISTVKPTRREAVVAACLELIEKETE